jgi:hypothetical protein
LVLKWFMWLSRSAALTALAGSADLPSLAGSPGSAAWVVLAD